MTSIERICEQTIPVWLQVLISFFLLFVLFLLAILGIEILKKSKRAKAKKRLTLIDRLLIALVLISFMLLTYSIIEGIIKEIFFN